MKMMLTNQSLESVNGFEVSGFVTVEGNSNSSLAIGGIAQIFT